MLTLDKISEITHAKLAGGKVVDAKWEGDALRIGIPYSSSQYHVYCLEELEDNNIQPLKLIERGPVEFTVEMGSRGDGFWFPIYCLDDAIAYQHAQKMKFRCVQVTEEA